MKILSKRIIAESIEESVYESLYSDDEEENELNGVFDELRYRTQRDQVDPKLNPEHYTDSDNWRNHWISMEG
jgi:hypothetical protein